MSMAQSDKKKTVKPTQKKTTDAKNAAAASAAKALESAKLAAAETARKEAEVQKLAAEKVAKEAAAREEAAEKEAKLAKKRAAIEEATKHEKAPPKVVRTQPVEIQKDTTGDLMSMLNEQEETEYANFSFKTNRVINMHSLENTAKGVLDVKISHRFGTVNNGIYDLFGIDAATQRIGFDYGITDNIAIGFNRNSVGKALDGFLKWRILRQSSGKKNMPVTLSVLTSMALETQKWAVPDRDNYFSSRMFYVHQLIVGRKFNEEFSLQLSPTMVWRNLVETSAEQNIVWAMGVGARYKLSKRVALTGEYIYVLPNQLKAGVYNSLSIGCDIETGGHVFQLHFTNSTSMSEYGFVTNNVDDFFAGKIHFGFNVSRVFTLYDPKKN
jgi:opacity protein-like surface antigen